MTGLPQWVYLRYLDLVDLVFSTIDVLLKETGSDKMTIHVTDAEFDPSIMEAVLMDELEKRGMTYRVFETPESSELVIAIVDNKEAHVKIYRQPILNVHILDIFLNVKS